jgi:TM2 domain-containing membrane protein YozV
MGTQLALCAGMENDYEDRTLVRRGPSPGIAAVLSVVIPGLGQVYNGNLFTGALWFAAVSFGYWAILVPGLFLHGISVWCAYHGARDGYGY